MSGDREAVLGRVIAALKPLTERSPLPDFEDEIVIMRKNAGVIDLWAQFTERMSAVNGQTLPHLDRLAEFLKAKGVISGYVDPVLLPLIQPFLGEGVVVKTVYDRTHIDEFGFCITRATAAIAETGTLIFSDRSTPYRLAALAPWVHIAVVKRTDIFADIPAAIQAMDDDPNIVWATGPSKTADVEGILIEGVHGPGIQAALLVD